MQGTWHTFTGPRTSSLSCTASTSTPSPNKVGPSNTPCQILSQSANRFFRYHDFLLYKMAAAAILDFRNFQILLAVGAQRTQMHHRVKFRQNSSIHCGVIGFSRWRPSAILDLFGEYLDHPRRIHGGLYHCAKFGCNRCTLYTLFGDRSKTAKS